MKPIEFTFEAVNKRGEKHLYGVNLNHALTTGFINKYSAVEIAFGSIRPLDNELDLDEAIYIGTQREEIRGLFYNLLGLAVSDDKYAFLLSKEQSFEEVVLENGCTTHFEVYGDGTSYIFRSRRSFETNGDKCSVCENLVFSTYEEAVRAFIKDFEYIDHRYATYYTCLEIKYAFNRDYTVWELPVPINEEL